MLTVFRWIILLILLLIPMLASGEGLTQSQIQSIAVKSWKHRIDTLSDLPFVVRVLPASGAFCSGVVVKKNYVLTAAHCFEGLVVNGTVVFADQHTAQFVVAYKTVKGSVGDFAILKTDTGGILPPPLSAVVPQAEELVFHVGHPLGYREQFTTYGIIVSRSPILIASTSISGESGGPVFDSQRRLFALIRASFFPPTLSQAVPIAPALKALSEVEGRE